MDSYCYLLATYDFVENRILNTFIAGETAGTITRVFNNRTTLLDIYKAWGSDYQNAYDRLIGFLFDDKCMPEYRWAVALMDTGARDSALHRLKQIEAGNA